MTIASYNRLSLRNTPSMSCAAASASPWCRARNHGHRRVLLRSDRGKTVLCGVHNSGGECSEIGLACQALGRSVTLRISSPRSRSPGSSFPAPGQLRPLLQRVGPWRAFQPNKKRKMAVPRMTPPMLTRATLRKMCSRLLHEGFESLPVYFNHGIAIEAG